MANEKSNCPVGGLILASATIELNAGRPRTPLKVKNTGDRPIQIGSHFHFFEVNAQLSFDREAAFGKRLDIPATTAIRFEPGDSKEVTLVPMGGKQRVFGFNGLVDGWTGSEHDHSYRPRLAVGMENVKRYGFKDEPRGGTGK